MDGHSLSKEERLHGRKKVDWLFREGKSGFAYPFRYIYAVSDAGGEEAPKGGGAGAAAMFSVPKKYFKRAVKRNLLKRRSREAYRLNKQIVLTPALREGKRVDIAFIYSSKEAESFKTIQDGIRRVLETVGKSV